MNALIAREGGAIISSMTKLVCVSDLHLDKETLGVSRFPEVERALWQAADHAIAINADAFLFLGDLADPDNGGATILAGRVACEVAMQLGRSGGQGYSTGIPSFWMVGNHDVFEDGSGLTTLESLRPLFDEFHVRLVDGPLLVEMGDDLSLVFLPYAPVARAYDPAKAAREMFARARSRVLVASHLNIPGIGPGEETIEMPRGREVMLPLEETRGAYFRLSGHYHARQDFDPGDGGPAIHIVGSPAAFAFGEHDGGAPAFSVIEL